MGPPTTPGPRTPHHLNPALSEVLNPVQYLFQAFNSLYAALLAAVSYISKPELLWVCSWCWRLSKLKWNRSARSKSTWAKSFLMLLYYRKQINQNQHKTVRNAVTTNVCGPKSSCELFPLTTTHTKVLNSSSGKVVIARYGIRYFFQKRAALRPSLLEN